MREGFARVVLVGAGVLVPLLSAEIALRAAGYQPLESLTGGRELFLRPSEVPGLAYDLRPRSRGFAWGESIEINSHGFRDRELPPEKAPGVTRIAALGDSIAFGNFLALEDTFPKQLERRLRERGGKFEVLNLGVLGYDTLEEVAFLEATGLRFEPDLVVLQHCINDLGTFSISHVIVRWLERFGGWVRWSRLLQLVTVAVDRHTAGSRSSDAEVESRYARLYRDALASLSADTVQRDAMSRLRVELGRHPRSTWPRFLPWYTSPERVARLRHAFGRLGELGRAHGFDVRVVIVPYLNEASFTKAYDLAYEIAAHEARRAGFAVTTVSDEYRRRETELAIRVGDRLNALHPNATGHRILAERLLRDICGEESVACDEGPR